MRVAILAIGSRGDVQPMIALGLGLAERGHQVQVAALSAFADAVAASGLTFFDLGDSPARFTRGPAGQRAGQRVRQRVSQRVGSFDGLSGRILFWTAYSALLPRYLGALEAACQGADAVVAGGLAFPAYHVAEALGVPYFWASPVPHTRTGAFLDPFFARHGHALGGARRGAGAARYLWPALCRWSHDAEERLRLQSTARVIAAWRTRTLGLPPIARRDLAAHQRRSIRATLYGCSPALVPRPPDWPGDVHLTGSWHLQRRASWQPPPALEDFLARRPAPVYIGFGAMTARDPEALGRLACEALRRSDQRGIVCGAGLRGRGLPDTIRAVDDVPHDWLFERVRLAVHHGGAGTSAAAVRAGLPQVVVPFAYDQFFWADALVRRGLAGASVPARSATAARLAGAVARTMLDRTVRRAAREVAAAVCDKDGVARACAVIESAAAAPDPPASGPRVRRRRATR